MPLIWLTKDLPYTMLFLFMQGVIGGFFIYFLWHGGLGFTILYFDI
jgi:hypothetical protein